MVLTGEEKKAYNKAYYQANKEKKKEYYEANKEKKKEYREDNKEKVKEQQKEYYEANKEKVKEHYEANKETIKEKRKCKHNRQKSICKECGGGSICEHNKRKSTCKECGGGSICEHNKMKSNCKECLNVNEYLVLLQRININRVIKSTNIEKTKPSIEYLGCSAEYFKEFIEKKMTGEMNWTNIHLDHIKPVSKFNLEDMDEFLNCCHYSNFQPLLCSDNLSKNNKWNDEDDLFWNENIKDKEFIEIYIPKH